MIAGQVIIDVNRTPVKNVSEFNKAMADVEGDKILFFITNGRGSCFIVVTID